MTLSELLDWARAQVRTEYAGYQGDLVNAFKPVAARWSAFIYHVPVPPDASQIAYRDVKMNHADYDYAKLLTHAVQQVKRYCGQALLVDEELYPFNPLQPMYERCRAMCAYVHSAAFNAPTIFLDGDAFLNCDPMPIFNAIKHVAVTYRNDLGLMPINEGVIFAKPCEETRTFFRAYLATYEHLAACPEVIEHYGDVKRWRGGQLSLNALTRLGPVHGEMDSSDVAGCHVQYLPCSVFNHALDMGRPYTGSELDMKAVCHLKGPRKVLVDQIIAYQTQP